MKSLKLYIDYMSQPCRAVFALSMLKKIPIQILQVRLNKKQHLTQHFKKINPLMKVPALEDQIKHISMGQSHTIMRYLSRINQKQKPQLYPVWDLKRTTKIDQYLDYHHIGVRSKLSSYIFNTVFTTILKQKNTNTTNKPDISSYNIQKGKNQVYQSLRQFQNVFLQKDKFIVGDELSIADISSYYQIHFLNLVNFKFQQMNRLNQWKDQMEKIKEINQANQIFLQLVKNIKERLGDEKIKQFQIL